ncbi:membrane hypothetical protein [uncultured Desulfatiglans sp.]|uniref:O-antigen ligase-related domain-containing protein n=1 Tax=Uncultured Desulfatiglans sp. TaxID=1748965 RepID=A0A653A6E8_UNCDX|nr:membrane hypothetical protein [uncultured Desulfatiglans sp.]
MQKLNCSKILSSKRNTVFSRGINSINNLVVITMFLAFLPNMHCIQYNITQYMIPIAYMIIPIISVTFLIHRSRYSSDNILLSFLWIIFLFWAFTTSLINLGNFNRTHIGYLLTVLTNIFVVAYPYTNLMLKKLSILSIFILLFLILTVIFFPQIPYIALKFNPNALALILVFLTIAIGYNFSHTPFLYTAIVIFNFFIIANYTKSRSAILMLTFYLLFYFLWPSLSKGKFFRPWLIFLSFIILSMTIPILTISAYLSEYGHKINEISRKMTDKNFFSGRERIWNEFFEDSANTTLLGKGLVRSSSSILAPLSLHNAWLNLLKQVGVVGLLLFIGILILIWKGLLARKSHYLSRIAASFLASFVLQQNFELALFHNNLGISLWLWIIIGLALAQPRDYRIGIGEGRTAFPLPYHRAYRSVHGGSYSSNNLLY